MIKQSREELNVLKLDTRYTLSSIEIEQYDYLELKNNFEIVLGIMNMNKIVHQSNIDYLNYEVDDNLNFNVDFKDYKVVDNFGTISSLGRGTYDFDYRTCILLLDKVRMAWDSLNQIEKYILKSLEFDYEVKTDEDLQEILLLSKNKYYNFKKSAYIKIGLFLGLNSEMIKYEKDYPNIIERMEYINSLHP